MSDARTIEILQEMLARELAAKNLYVDLAQRVQGTEFEHLHAPFQAMADEEAEHVDRCQELLATLRAQMDSK